MKTLKIAALVSLVAIPAVAQERVPDFFADTYPAYALDEAVAWYGTLTGGKGSLDAKTRELIMLGVAAQIPCTYCVHGHTRVALAAGATDAEIKDAVAAAAAVRMWSTVLNGTAYPLEDFKTEFDAIVPLGPTN